MARISSPAPEQEGRARPEQEARATRETLAARHSGAIPPLIPAQKTEDKLSRRMAQDSVAVADKSWVNRQGRCEPQAVIACADAADFLGARAKTR